MNNYKLEISPRMLEILSRDLYTNIYFVFAELIANAYDADAENVYLIIRDNYISVEDDGKGMNSYTFQNDFLQIGKESRNKTEESKTSKGRLKMGRKGVGKLSALAISNGFEIFTCNKGVKTGVFFPDHIEHDDQFLSELSNESMVFEYISNDGTKVIMREPIIEIPKTFDTIYNNISKIFPFEQEDFKIHIVYKKKMKTISMPEKIIMRNLITLISYGDEYADYSKFCNDIAEKNIVKKEEIKRKLILKNKLNIKKEYNLIIKGWIGTMKTTKNTKKTMEDFSDNFIAIFANSKMGARNILQSIGKNRVFDSYITSNLYIDLFEESELHDMASTNRQGYNESDLRWQTAKSIIRDCSDDIVKMHSDWTKDKDKAKEINKLEKLKEKEEKLIMQVDKYKAKVTMNITKKYREEMTKQEVVELVKSNIELSKKVINLKNVISNTKRKILLSQTGLDYNVASLIYSMLLFNGIDKKEIIFSNSGNFESDLPEKDIYGYLKNFFVESYNKDDMIVIYVTSNNVFNKTPKEGELPGSWGCLMEMGAGWVIKDDYYVFNVYDFTPEAPINNGDKWVDIRYDNDSKIISMFKPSAVSFCNKIHDISTRISSNYKSHEENMDELLLQVKILQ